MGRKRKICPEDCPGLVLAWTRKRRSLMALQLIFWMTFSNLDDYLCLETNHCDGAQK